jgi:Flp pilus assembly protein TadD
MKYSLAMNVYEHALQHKPQDPALHYNLGLVYSNIGRAEEADACFRRALVFGPRNETVYSCFLFNLHYLETSTREDIFNAQALNRYLVILTC